MLKKIIFTIFVIRAINSVSYANPIPEFNITTLLLYIETTLAELKAEHECLLKLLDIPGNESDFHTIKTDFQTDNELINSEQNQLKNGCKIASNGIYDVILPNFNDLTFKVVCDANTQEGGWTIILRRQDGSVDFYRNWTEYKNGFGDLEGEFFLGLDKIHALTSVSRQELLVVLEDFEGAKAFVRYEEFAIGDEDQQYELHTLGKASGTVGDSLDFHRGRKFSTFDRDNDQWNEGNCAENSTGAWWYSHCLHSNLAGRFNKSSYAKGVNWYHFRGYEYSLKKAIMMIRPKSTY